MRRTKIILLCGLIAVASPFLHAAAQGNLLDQAKTAFVNAQKMESSMAPASRKRADTLKLIEAYQRVYLITPHTTYADDALFAVAHLYEQIQNPADAIKTLRFMLRDYPQTPFKAEAERDIERLQNIREPQAPVAENKPEPGLKPEAVAAPAGKTVNVENVRYLEGKNSVRVVIDLGGDIRFTQGEAKNPDRVFVDILSSKLNVNLVNKQWPVNSTVLRQIRAGQFDNTTVRIVFDVGVMQSVNSFTLRDPYRLIVDMVGKGPSALPPLTENPPFAPQTGVNPTISAVTPAPPSPASTTPAPAVSNSNQVAVASAVPPVSPPPAASPSGAAPTPARPTNRGGTSLVRSLGLKLSKVVIDAGHGGNDTGTVGPTGFTEKELSLDVARRLKTLIENELGAEVVLTRNDDVFVSLEARTAIANQNQADLFISIHANSSKVASARGVETFYLNYPPPSRDALELASRENASSQASIHELQDIIKKIMMNDKASESRELASHIQKAMAARKDAGPDRGVKEAPFVVLIGANMPSILAEVSFISNPQEERSAKTPAYRQQIAESLFKGIRSYAETLSGVKTANSYDKE
jgi:N-acetylmuramoyl-L-alanine amidase